MQDLNQYLMSEIIRKFSTEFDEKVKNKVKDNLEKFYNIVFEYEHEFMRFAKSRLTMIEDMDEERSFIYLDYRDDENRGLIVLSYSTKAEFSWNEDHTKITATFGA